MGMEGPQIPSQDEGSKVEQPAVETDNFTASEKAEALLKNEQSVLDELLKQYEQLRLELWNAKDKEHMANLNSNESILNMSREERFTMWERQAKIEDTEINAIAQKIDELTSREIIPQQHCVADAKDALSRAQEG